MGWAWPRSRLSERGDDDGDSEPDISILERSGHLYFGPTILAKERDPVVLVWKHGAGPDLDAMNAALAALDLSLDLTWAGDADSEYDISRTLPLRPGAVTPRC